MSSIIQLAFKIRLPVLGVVACLLGLSGCIPPKGEEVSEQSLASFRNGEDYLRQGRHDQALTAFLKVIDTVTVAPESHLNVGQLYLEHAKDPVLAIYHFREYLKFNPTSRQAPMVRELIDTAKKEFARTFPANLFDAELERMDMLNVIEQKDAEILSLKKELARIRAEANSLNIRLQEVQSRTPSYTAPEPSVLPQQRRVQPLPRSNLLDGSQASAPSGVTGTYTVVAGDNLLIISQKVYGTSNRYNEIFEANRDIMPNVNTLNVGMKLKIP
ncbi:MAG: LysM peptidoglycan-binding domain-containing protein [Verrucomicrobia bacterium]|nr:LysM peptidoglycan-binding domain-containing protein [Verrucomicrobiota bacterium]MDA1064873.1 LysM peptidoglycan-binding domain-containing protein [Verrucomicrobiota bacterium]